jgi:hypothetical protein
MGHSNSQALLPPTCQRTALRHAVQQLEFHATSFVGGFASSLNPTFKKKKTFPNFHRFFEENLELLAC